jgi:hypothetical protein
MLHSLYRLVGRRKHRPAAAPPIPSDIDSADADTIRRVQKFTLTSPERIAALCEAVTYVVHSDVPGAIVECGVWRGGSMMAVAHTLLRLDRRDRVLYLFDTYDGMTAPGQHDVDLCGGNAAELLANESREVQKSIWCVSPLAEVQKNLRSTGYPDRHIHFVKGRVEDTIPAAAPRSIAILRLDTDWYESTRHELEHLYPRLQPGGVIVIDDYGHWQGARRAVDEYFERTDTRILLNRVDYTGRIGVVGLPSSSDKAA